MTRKQRAAICALAGWPIVALPAVCLAYIFGVKGMEPYYLITVGAAIGCLGAIAGAMLTIRWM